MEDAPTSCVLGTAGRERAGRQGDRQRRDNAQNNSGLDPRTLVVATVYADEGPTAKRIRPRAQGLTDPQAHHPRHGDRGEPPAARPARRTVHLLTPRAGQQGGRSREVGDIGSRHGARGHEGPRQKAPAKKAAARREARSGGPEDQPPRLPARYHHRLEVPVVRRQAVRRLRPGEDVAIRRLLASGTERAGIADVEIGEDSGQSPR